MSGAEPGAAGAVSVLVVGAGPTGLALAAQLVAFGIDVRVVEQRLDDQPSRAFIVQPRTLEVLTPTGIADRLVARGDRSARARIRSRRHGGGDAVVSLARPGGAETPYPFLLALPQVEVEHALAEHLSERGLRVERGVRLRSLAQTGDGVRCQLVHRSGRGHTGDQTGTESGTETVEEVTAAWVVGCDGVDSTVRRRAGISFPTRVYRPRLLLADVDLDGDIDGDIDAGTVHGVIDGAGAVFLFPFPDHDGWRLLTVLDPDADADPTRDQLLVDDLVHRSFDGAVTVRRLRWVQRVELRRGQADRYRQDRILLAGDAAHVHSPAGAQGMNTGLHDAVNLGWKLALVASGRSSPDLLDSYQTERWPVARWTRRLTDAAFLFEAGHVPPIGWLRRNVAPRLVPLARGRSLPSPLFRLLGGLWTRYPRGTLAEEGRPRIGGGVRAGGRVPDGALLVEGRTVRLHHLLHPPGFHVLLCDNRPGTTFDWPAPDSAEGRALTSVGPIPLSFHRLSSVAGIGVAHDSDGRLLRRLGVSGTAVQLIRPDGYLGYRAAGTDLSGLAHHLDRYRQRDRPAAAG